MPDNILLLTLQTFSTTGGIQKMTRTLGYSLNRIATQRKVKFGLWSLYDAPATLLGQYLPAENFRGFARSRIGFVLSVMLGAPKIKHLIISHINLSLLGLLVKLINPRCQVYLVAHGIEVWRPLNAVQRRLLHKCHCILCVSSYTQQEMIARHGIAVQRTRILNNALDPFMPVPATFGKPEALLQRYRLSARNQVIFTLTRLASTEQYKGYEQVIRAMGGLKVNYPDLRYILAGQYDAEEEQRIDALIRQYHVEDEVLVTGFIPDVELTDHFLLADLFVLPSKKEGFGLVFIEALACGLPVISGNADGSTDALKHGELGQCIDADQVSEVERAIRRCLSQPPGLETRRLLREKCAAYFNEPRYRSQLEHILQP